MLYKGKILSLQFERIFLLCAGWRM